MTAIPLDALVEEYTPEGALEDTLTVAASTDLPVTSWLEGEPTLTTLELLAYWVAREHNLARNAIASGFLDWAPDDDWLTVLAKQVYDVDRIEARFATVPMTLNNGDEVLVIGEGDITVENSGNGKTYRNVEPVAPATITITALQQITLTFRADEAGSGSSADSHEIDNVVTGQIGMSCTNQVAAVGYDRELGDALKARCRLKVPAISKTAAGPKGKYAYVAITPSENGGAATSRCDVRRVGFGGRIDICLATPSGAASGGDIALVEAALVMFVIGPTETLNVFSATEVVIDITYELWVYDDVNIEESTLKASVSQRLGKLFSIAPIGGWKKATGAGRVWLNLLEATIKSVTTRSFQVEVAGSDTTLTENQVPRIGTVAGTVHFIATPPTGGTLP